MKFITSFNGMSYKAIVAASRLVFSWRRSRVIALVLRFDEKRQWFQQIEKQQKYLFDVHFAQLMKKLC